MIIVVAILVAHFVDKAFYTVKDSSLEADNTVKYLAAVLKLSIALMIGYVFWRLYRVVKAEPLLQINMVLFNIHIVALSLYFILWTAY